MAKAAHKPPSRIRYEQSHPTVSCRLSKDTYALLKQRLEDLGGVSFADFVKDSLGLLELKMPDTEEIEEGARAEGYEEAKKDYRIWYLCNVCGEQIDVEPNDTSHKAIIGYMRKDRWGHQSCHRQ